MKDLPLGKDISTQHISLRRWVFHCLPQWHYFFRKPWKIVYSFPPIFLNPCLSDYKYIRGEVDDGFSLYPYSSFVYHQYNVLTLSIQKKINRNKEKRAQEYA